jgi:hypothetical protein
MAAEVDVIDRRRKNSYGGSLEELITEGVRQKTRHLLGNGASIHEYAQPLPKLLENYRQAASYNVLRVIATALLIKAPP